MINPNIIANNIEELENGIWVSRTKKFSSLSYPNEGSRDYFKIENNSFWFMHRKDCLIEVLKKFPPGGTIFDIGGGNGYISLALKKNGIDTILVEPDIVGARNAKMRGVTPIICSTVDDAKFVENVIPAVGLFDVIEHLPNDVDFLINLKKKLVKRGRIYISVPAYKALWSMHDKCAGHYRRYNLNELTKKLKFAGYNIEYATYLFSCLVIPIFFFKTILTMIGFGKMDTHKAEVHHLKKGVQKKLIYFLLKRELSKIIIDKTIKYGSSCLVVARSKT